MNTLKHILVVEDEVDIGYVLHDFLTEEGFRVTYVTKGIEALEAVRKNRYDLILLDFYLPDFNANQIVRELHRQSLTTPVIVVSANLSELSPHPLIKKTIPKPFDLNYLLDAVSDCA